MASSSQPSIMTPCRECATCKAKVYEWTPTNPTHTVEEILAKDPTMLIHKDGANRMIWDLTTLTRGTDYFLPGTPEYLPLKGVVKLVASLQNMEKKMTMEKKMQETAPPQPQTRPPEEVVTSTSATTTTSANDLPPPYSP